MTLHVGRGTTYGTMTVFPLWSTETRWPRYSVKASNLDVSETEEPDVGTLLVGNVGDRPALVLEGQLFEGGWQHRMSVRSLLIGVHQRIPVEVACVERGRWNGERRQHTSGRRATPYVAAGTRGTTDLQGEVWARIATRTRGSGNATESLVTHIDRGGSRPPVVQPLGGQVGVLIGIGGQPYVAEVFDSHTTLRHQLPAVVAAAWEDTAGAPSEPTPGRRARRFVARLEEASLGERHPAGLGMELGARTPWLDVSALRWQDRLVHQRVTHLRHPLLVGAGQ